MHTRHRSTSFQTKAARTVFAIFAIAPMASAAPFYWGQTGYSSGSIYDGTAATATNWYSDAAATTPAGAAPSSSSSDDIFFNTTPANAVGGTVTVGASFGAKSLTFNTSGNTILEQNAINRTLDLGTGGLTVNSGSGAVNIGTNAHNPPLTVQVTDDQTWTNSSTSTLTVRRMRTAASTGAASVSINAASSGNIVISLGIIDTVDDPLAVVIDSAGGGLTTFSGTGTSNTYRGGTTIKRGALSAFGSLGSGAVLLGDTSGTSGATLNVRTSSGFSNNITVRAGSSGTKTLTTNQTGGVVLNGTLTLEDSLVLTTSTDGTFNNAISGTGDLVKGGAAALMLAGDNTLSGDLTIDIGSLTLADGGSFEFTIQGNGLNNRINGASSGAVAFNGTFVLDITGASLADGNSWTLVSLLNTAETYGDTFAITGFTQTDNVWSNGSGLTFEESSGVLSYAIPEPSTGAFLMGAGLLFASMRKRQRSSHRA